MKQSDNLKIKISFAIIAVVFLIANPGMWEFFDRMPALFYMISVFATFIAFAAAIVVLIRLKEESIKMKILRVFGIMLLGGIMLTFLIIMTTGT